MSEDFKARAVAVYDHPLFAKHAAMAAHLLKSELASSRDIIGAMEAAEQDHQEAIQKAAARSQAPQQPLQQSMMTLEQLGRASAESLLRSEPMPDLGPFNDPSMFAQGRAIAERLRAQGYCAFSSAREAA
jgi:hypothetical protein